LHHPGASVDPSGEASQNVEAVDVFEAVKAVEAIEAAEPVEGEAVEVFEAVKAIESVEAVGAIDDITLERSSKGGAASMAVLESRSAGSCSHVCCKVSALARMYGCNVYAVTCDLTSCQTQSPGTVAGPGERSLITLGQTPVTGETVAEFTGGPCKCEMHSKTATFESFDKCPTHCMNTNRSICCTT
jgi:hypothetical protein